MSWLVRKIDSLIGAVVAAAGALGASQFPAFVLAYRQRLGGHLAEAQFNIRQTVDSQLYGTLDPEAQRALLVPMLARLSELNDASNALSLARSWELPWVFVRELDWSIARAALEGFQMSLPANLSGLGYAGVGLVLGWIVYDLVKVPFRRRRDRGLFYGVDPAPDSK